jgi:two-component system, chemotaxis family, chemotaxis protein CheY
MSQTARVLVVDDAATVRAYHGAVLRDGGFEVAEAANGYEALEQCLAEGFALHVVDVNMPQMDGYSYVEAMRREGLLSDAPVIMISTEGEAGDAARAYAAGANLYMVKPVDPEQLLLTAQILTNRLAAEATPLQEEAP